MKYTRQQLALILMYVLFAVVYILQTIDISNKSPSLAKYHLTTGEAIALSLTVAIPLIMIWAAGLIGYLNLRNYARTITKGKDGLAMCNMARGIFWLLLWLPVTTILGRLASDFGTAHSEYANSASRISLYVSLLLLLGGYYWLNVGAKQSWALVRSGATGRAMLPRSMIILSVLFAALYIFVVFRHSEPGVRTVLPYLPDWAVFISVVLPRLFMWFLGLEAIWYLYKYTKLVHGSIYRQALSYLTLGLMLVTICLIGVGYLGTVSSLNHISLRAILAIVYVLLVVMAVGYVVMAVGAVRLKRIEQA